MCFLQVYPQIELQGNTQGGLVQPEHFVVQGIYGADVLVSDTHPEKGSGNSPDTMNSSAD